MSLHSGPGDGLSHIGRGDDPLARLLAESETEDETLRRMVLREGGKRVAAERDVERLTCLLYRWLIEASAMGGGPRARLTQDTLDAVGMPLDSSHAKGCDA